MTEKQPVKIGDDLFICFPQSDNGAQIVYNYVWADGANRAVTGKKTIEEADPYFINLAGHTGEPDKTPVHNNIVVNIHRKLASHQDVLYNPDGDGWIQIRDTNWLDPRSQWRIELVNSQSNNDIVYYGDLFRLYNQAQPYNIQYTSHGAGNLYIGNANNNNNSYIMFLPGPVANAKLECCKNNPIFIDPDYCGNLRGNLCNGYCDNILTNYCATNISDPKCGCLLPASYYTETKLIGLPECIDTRCITGNTYKRKDQCNPNCSYVNCTVDLNNVDLRYVDKVKIRQLCGNQPSAPNGDQPSAPNGDQPSNPPSQGTPTSNTTRWLLIGGGVVLLILVIIIIIVYILSKNKKD
ncbi:putative virion-associated membrane protein [Tupanvirus deep ocean]|uniref:Virion-associated membrane protein n=2 Tax=Tupanvirus TaxID=2094720 RepID=A0AC62A9M1_9VIRU|nr:putative virion-associated membrane protein [Tupanvirus deep ocean]QKU34419.1 putative virion-associated membrane protein [Tupanvirus deep ocean]